MDTESAAALTNALTESLANTSNKLTPGVTGDLAALQVPRRVVEHFATYHRRDRYVADFTATFGTPPDDSATLGQWAQALNIHHSGQLLEWLRLVDGAEFGGDAPINARLMGEVAARAAELVLPQIAEQPWAAEVQACADLITRLADGEPVTREMCNHASTAANKAVTADLSSGPMWGWSEISDESPTLHMFYGTACQVPLPPERKGASPEKRIAMHAAFVVLAALYAAAPLDVGTVVKVSETKHMIARHALDAAVIVDPENELRLRQYLAERLEQTVPDEDPIVRDVRALRFESADIAAQFQALRSGNRWGRMGPIWPEVVKNLQAQVLAYARPHIGRWRAAGRPRPFTLWLGTKLNRHEWFALDDLAVKAAFMQSPGAANIREEIGRAARAVDPTLAGEALEATIAAAGLPVYGADLAEAVICCWHGEENRVRPNGRLDDPKAVRAALVCTTEQLLTEEEWAMEPGLD